MFDDVTPSAVGFWLLVLIVIAGVLLTRAKPDRADRRYTWTLLGSFTVGPLVLMLGLVRAHHHQEQRMDRMSERWNVEVRELQDKIDGLEQERRDGP